MNDQELKKQYKDAIIHMVENIENLKHLISIYSFTQVKFFKKNTGE